MTARKWFAISAFLLLVLVAVVAVNSYNQDWKKYQRAYYTRVKTEKFLEDLKEQAGKLRAEADKIASQDPARAESLRQTAQHLEEKAQSQGLSFLEQASIALDSEMELKIKKVVTEGGRSADLCMSCHTDVEKLSKQHERVSSLVEKFPFDQVGCTACHGGDRLALTVKGAHRDLRNDFAKNFEESLGKLRSPKWMERQAGIERIRWMTGQDFGFSFSAPEESRNEAIQRVIEWWNLHKDTFLEEGLGERSSPFKTENPLAKKIEQQPDISAESDPLKFVGSGTCIACHAHPGISEAYISPTQKTHIDRWFRDAFMTKKNPEAYVLHPFAPLLIQDERRRREITDYLADQQRKGEPVEIAKVEDFIEALKTIDVTCEACHGPGSEYVQLMQKGFAMDAQARAYDQQKKLLDAQIKELQAKIDAAEKAGRTTEAEELKKQLKDLQDRSRGDAEQSSGAATRASEWLSKAKTIARCNARHNLSDPRIWLLLERLIERAGPSPTAGEGPSPNPSNAANIHCE